MANLKMSQLAELLEADFDKSADLLLVWDNSALIAKKIAASVLGAHIGWIDVKRYGTAAGGTALAAAIAANPSGGALYFGESFSIISAIEIPKEFSLADGPYRIFNCSGAGAITFGAGSLVKEVYPEWWATNTTPGTTDMTAAINAAFTTGKSVLFIGGPYLFSSTLTPKHNPTIRFLNGAKLEASAGGTYTEMLDSAGAGTGLYVLFDCIDLGVLLSVSYNRNNTLVENLLIDANSIANTIGVGQTKCWGLTGDDRTSPCYTFINTTVDDATYGLFAQDSPYQTVIWGQFTGSTFINFTTKTCANGVYLGLAQDDITMINLRVTVSTGFSLKIRGNSKNIVSAFLNPWTGNGIILEPANFANHFGTIFIECVNPDIPLADYAIKLNAGAIGSWSEAAHFICDALHINYPDGTGTGAGMRKLIFNTNQYNTVKIRTYSKLAGNTLPYTYQLWLDLNTSLPNPSVHEIGWAHPLSTFQLGLNATAATYAEQSRWITNVRLTGQDGAGTYYGYKWVRDGEFPLDYQTSTTTSVARLNGSGLSGMIYLNSTGANKGVTFSAPEATPQDGQLFKFTNSISSNGTVTLQPGTTATVLGGGLDVLAIGQSADFAYKASDTKWTQLNRY